MAETKLIKNHDSWMADMWNVIGNRPLRDIVLPGTHDSGIYQLSEKFPLIGPDECNTRTQEFKIKEQLEKGARYFDVRPAFWSANDTWYLAHGGVRDFGFTGAFGEKLQDVLNDVRDFAKGHPKELVILLFSHYDRVGAISKEGARACNYEEKEAMLKIITNTLNDVMFKSNDFHVRLADRTPQELVSGGRTVLCVFEDMNLFAAPDKGIFGQGGNMFTTITPGLTVGGDKQVNCAYIPKDGPNNGMMRFVSSPGGSGNWSRLDLTMHGQLAKRGPSLAQADGKLYAVFVEPKFDELLLVKSENGGRNWTDNFSLKQKAHADPSLIAANDGTLYVLYLNGNDLKLTISSDCGENWTEGPPLKQTSKFAPSLAIDSTGTLYALYVANNESNELLLTTLPKDEKTWTKEDKVGGQQAKMGSALLIDSKDNLHVIFVAADNTNTLLLTTRPKGQKEWTKQRGIIGASRMGIVGAVGPDDALYVLFPANDDSQTLLLFKSTDHGEKWSDMGIKAYSNLDIESDYPDSHEVRVVRTFAKGRLCCFRPAAGVIHSMSWTGTWHRPYLYGGDHARCIDQMAKDLLYGDAPARERDKSLLGIMESWVKEGVITSQKRPNIVSVDYYNSDVLDTIEYLNTVLR